MGKRDPRVDTYIAKSADFAVPILNHLRKVVHAACPDVEETLKWGFPHFMHEGILCSMASFRSHCAFGFWKGALLAQKYESMSRTMDPAMGQFGKITSISDLPAERTLRLYVKKAVALNDQGVPSPTRVGRKNSRSLDVPPYFLGALRRNREALATWKAFSPAKRQEYVEWVTEAKMEETRKRRLETAVAWMAEGKVRNWKYLKK